LIELIKLGGTNFDFALTYFTQNEIL